MGTEGQAAAQKMIFRKTNVPRGRHVFITSGNGPMQHLAYARILLNPSKSAESFSTGNRERGLICLSGQAVVTVGQKDIEISRYDAIYVPSDSSLTITTKTSADILEHSADVANRYPLQVVRSREMFKDPGLKFSSGGPGCTRRLRVADRQFGVFNVQPGSSQGASVLEAGRKNE